MIETVLDPVGVEVTELSLAEVDDAVVARLVALLATHGVLIMRRQPIDDSVFLDFLLHFGGPVFTAGETPVPGLPDLNIVSNVGRGTPPRSVFHVDTSYVSAPPAYTALRAVAVPAAGGQTLFTNQYRAYEALSPRLREHLAGRTVTHGVSGVDPGDEQEHAADHPLFRAHPVSGRIALYLSTPERCRAISGMPTTEAEATIEFLYAHSTAVDNVHRHEWRPDDVVMWDNGCVMHKADHSGVHGDRILHRGMVDGYAARSVRQS